MRRILGVLMILSALGWVHRDALGADVARLRFVAAVYADAKGVGMREPEGVACTDRSLLVVADTGGGRLLTYKIEDRTVTPTGELVAPQLSAPIVVQVNSKDEVFALDGKQRRIVRFDAKGQSQGYVRPEGVPEPTTVVPRSFKIGHSDEIYLLDVFSARVLVLAPDGKYLRHVKFPEDRGFFSDLAVDARGSIYLLDSVRSAVSVARRSAATFSPLAPKLKAHVSFPTAMLADARGILYLVDHNGGGVVLLGPDGAVLGRQLARGWNEGLLYYPSQMCLNDKGQAFIADQGNSRVQFFSLVR